VLCSILGHCLRLPCFSKHQIFGWTSTCLEIIDFSSLGHYLNYLLRAYLGQSSRVNWRNSEMAWREFGKFLSVYCGCAAVLDSKFHWCFFLSIPYATEVDRKFQLDCSLTLVVTGALPSVLHLTSSPMFHSLHLLNQCILMPYLWFDVHINCMIPYVRPQPRLYIGRGMHESQFALFG